MDSTDAADLIAEIHEERAENAGRRHLPQPRRPADRRARGGARRRRAGRRQRHRRHDRNNIKASDTWAFYQAKNVRQTMYEIEAEKLKAALAAGTVAPAERAVGRGPAQGL